MKWLAAVCVAAACGTIASARSPDAGLTKDNFVDIGDAIVDMLDTSRLAFATLLIGEAATPAARRAAFGPLAGVPRSQPFEAPCPGGGSVAGTITDADADGTLSTRDRFVTVFRSCRADVDGEVVSGSSEFVVSAHRVEGTTEVTELRFRFEALGTDALRWSGRATVALRTDQRNGSERYVVDYHDLSVQRGGRTWRWNYRLEVRRPPLGDHTASIDGTIAQGPLSLALVQDDPFVLADDGAPRSGRLTATDGDGDRLQVEAGRRRYRYSFFVRATQGDTPDSTSQSRTRR
jgi:hypothetical protein